MNYQQITARAQEHARFANHTTLANANSWQLHSALSSAMMEQLAETWAQSAQKASENRRAYYLSAEFLVGRAIQNNMLCLDASGELARAFEQAGANLSLLEEVEDAALGNGGLGRLAACFLDSAATLSLPLDGYGIRYRFGLFRQTIEAGFQREYADDWARYGDPWSVRRTDEAVTVTFADGPVIAVPYDMPIIGYGGRYISTLRLWQCEPENEFNFALFDGGRYDRSVTAKNRAEDISRVLYPNDNTPAGKLLRLRQQYFFTSASMQDILRRFKQAHGNDFTSFAEWNACQLNDTHPVIAIPELIRLLVDGEGLLFEQAFEIAQRVFSYTNHTIMQEALEKWSKDQISKVVPRIMELIVQIDAHYRAFCTAQKLSKETRKNTPILQGKTVHMANLAVYATSFTNGVAEIHTDILKNRVLADWYTLFPERFQNKTNGITQRRWLGLCNKELSAMVTRLLGHDEWLTDLSKLAQLERFADDDAVLEEFMQIKQEKRHQLARYVIERDGITISPDSIIDAQIKRLHEYKRQLLNILAILHLCFEMEEGKHADFYPTTFLFGAKSAPGYLRAKGIIKLINEVGRYVAGCKTASQKMQVVFVSNYNVSYAEKIVAAADVSEQISTAGTEASGTGNMKFMLNGAVTLGTMDGANVEIVREAGLENNFIFGAQVEELEKLRPTYDPKEYYESDPHIRRVLDALVDGTLDDGGTGAFQDLHDALLEDCSWQKADYYFLLHDFESYVEAKLLVNRAYQDRQAFARKCFLNMCKAGWFSSDRTIADYAQNIWRIKPCL